MNRMPRPPIPMKPALAWVIVDPWGNALLSTSTNGRRNSIEIVMSWWPNETWKQQYRLGYRCQRVLVAR